MGFFALKLPSLFGAKSGMTPITLKDGAPCCCGEPSPCNKVYYRYDPCAFDPDFHVECIENVRETPVYMRCDVKCPEGCGIDQDETSPPGIKYRDWCHHVKVCTRPDGSQYWCRYYKPEDFEGQDPPEDAVPLPDGAEIVELPDWCLSTNGTSDRVCFEPCCKCWRWYCGTPCPCFGLAPEQRCTEGTRAFFRLRRDNKCLTGDCYEFDTPIGFDERPPGSIEVGGIDPGTCCERAAQPACGDCQGCVQASYVYQHRERTCNVDGPLFERQFECCCDPTDIAASYHYSYVYFGTVGFDSVKRASANAQGFLPVGVQFDSQVCGIYRVEYMDGQGNTIRVETYPVTLHMTKSCVPVASLPSVTTPVGTPPLGPSRTINIALSANCELAYQTINTANRCPPPDDFSYQDTISQQVLGVTYSRGPRSAKCNAGCRDTPAAGFSPRRKLPTPLELLG